MTGTRRTVTNPADLVAALAIGFVNFGPINRLEVNAPVETFGGTGPFLVKGVVVPLPAVALSIKPGGSARRIAVAGGLCTRSPGIDALQLHGDVAALSVEGGFGPAGGGFEPI